MHLMHRRRPRLEAGTAAAAGRRAQAAAAVLHGWTACRPSMLQSADFQCCLRFKCTEAGAQLKQADEGGDRSRALCSCRSSPKQLASLYQQSSARGSRSGERQRREQQCGPCWRLCPSTCACIAAPALSYHLLGPSRVKTAPFRSGPAPHSPPCPSRSSPASTPCWRCTMTVWRSP